MSYARFAIDSNVYVWAGQDSITCIVEDDVAKKYKIEPCDYEARYTLQPGEAETMMLGWLTYLANIGVMVPERATEALTHEIEELCLTESS